MRTHAPAGTSRRPEEPRSGLDYERAYELRRALREFQAASERITHRHGLTPERYQLLLFVHVAGERGARATVNELATAFRLAPSSATQLVRRAENLRLVRRELSDRDARIRYLRLTDEGRRRLAGAVAELGEERARLHSLISG
jgi:DNA-binding MarR family transcriptional regulator